MTVSHGDKRSTRIITFGGCPELPEPRPALTVEDFKVISDTSVLTFPSKFYTL